MTPEAEKEIARLTAAVSEPGSVEPAIRAAMVYGIRESARICHEEFALLGAVDRSDLALGHRWAAFDCGYRIEHLLK